jgi:hypothetical protein
MSDDNWKEWPDGCADCGYGTPNYEDPRTPPLEFGNEVLCEDCYAAAIYDLKEQVECDCERYTKILDELGVPV